MVSINKSPQPAESSTHGQVPPPNNGQLPPSDYSQTPPSNHGPPPPSAPTVIFVHAPPPPQPPPPPQLPTWSTGLFDCFSDIPSCFMTSILPCVTYGQIAEIVDQGSIPCEAHAAIYAVITLVTGLQFLKSCVYRSRLRRMYNLPPDPCSDCMVHFCCECFALCQEYRELQNRGFNMFQGWEGNAEKQDEGVRTMAPTVHGGMNR